MPVALKNISLEKFRIEIAAYILELERKLKTGIAGEHAHRPALQKLLESFCPGVNAVNDATQTQYGRPDFVITEHLFPRGYVEAKDIGENLDRVEETGQFKRYLGLQNLIVTDYLEFRWYVLEQFRGPSVRLGQITKSGKVSVDPEAVDRLHRLLDGFYSRPVPSVRSPKELASRMARLAQNLVEVITLVLQKEEDPGPLHMKFRGFKKILLHELKQSEFADIYAQTLVYGFFAARVNHTQGAQFTREKAATELPRTNPFLRRMFQTFADESNTLADEGIDWVINDLVDLLRNANIDEIMYGFGLRTGREDPVVHFYETFLKAYNPKLRFDLGVFYTPDQVVGYIVRSVDSLLRSEFGIQQGLSDTSKVSVIDPETKEEAEMHRVLILDPATGTGTFLHHVVNEIYDKNFQDSPGSWSSYVSTHLLPRLIGFERLMAPYAVAHMKLGLQLKKLGYDFKTNERLRVYLTNTLEAATFVGDELFAGWLSAEANAASSVKLREPVMVIMGNPPYKGHSPNPSRIKVHNEKTGKTKWTLTEIGRLLESYREIDGVPLGERNPKWLQNDYVKFVRYAQAKIDRVGYGVLGMITANSYLDGPTFRGMRHSLLKTFDKLFILNLHGNPKKKNLPSGVTLDENVFDITEDVAIMLFVKSGDNNPLKVFYHELWGPRTTSEAQEGKFEWLSSNSVESTPWMPLPTEGPGYAFIPRAASDAIALEYSQLLSTRELFPTGALGFQSHRDDVAIAFSLQELKKQVKGYLTEDYSESSFRKFARQVDYRPFDVRWAYMGKDVCDRPRDSIMRHMTRPNLALNVMRQTKDVKWNHAIVSCRPTPAVYVEVKDGCTTLPLWSYSGFGQETMFENRTPNLDARALQYIKSFGSSNAIDPESFFSYAYAVLSSSGYKKRYSDLLRTDFPRVPLASDKTLFFALCGAGKELINCHLLRDEDAGGGPKFPIVGTGEVESVVYDGEGRVYINSKQYFSGVSPNVWNALFGSYNVCSQWLSDRAGCTLSFDDVDYYRRIVGAIERSQLIIARIDDIIDRLGGWPIA